MGVLDTTTATVESKISLDLYRKDKEALEKRLWPDIFHDFEVGGWKLGEYPLHEYTQFKFNKQLNIVGSVPYMTTKLDETGYSFIIEPAKIELQREEPENFEHTLVMQSPIYASINYTRRVYVRGYKYIVYCGELFGHMGVWWNMCDPTETLYSHMNSMNLIQAYIFKRHIEHLSMRKYLK